MGKRKIEFVFDDDGTADIFLGWLSDGGGEQGFMEAVGYRDDDGPTQIDIDYHGGSMDGDEFGKHPIIVTAFHDEDEQ